MGLCVRGGRGTSGRGSSGLRKLQAAAGRLYSCRRTTSAMSALMKLALSAASDLRRVRRRDWPSARLAF